jgi:colanic acid/amylovoran biosynthesis protein
VRPDIWSNSRVPSERAEPKNVLLMHFSSDKNRGDAAIQIALIQLVRERLPHANVTVMSGYGSNQWSYVKSELDQTAELADAVVGGIRPTFVTFESRLLHVAWVRKTLNLTTAVGGVCMLPVWRLLAAAPALDVLLPGQLRRSVRALRKADLVLWKGLNFRASTARREPYEIWRLVYNPIVALIFGKPVACIGASVWPLKHPVARFLIRHVMGRTSFTSLREADSYANACAYLGGMPAILELLPDLSLAVLARPGIEAIAARRLPREPSRIGITVMDWPGAGKAARDRYVQSLLGFLSHFLERSGTQAVLIPQAVVAMQETTSLEHILRRHLAPEKFEVLPGTPRVSDLLPLYGQIDLLVATRMHSAIFALCQGTPVVTIPYDAGGKWGILDMIGAHDLAVPFEGISAELLEQKAQSVWARRNELCASVLERLPELAELVKRNVNAPIDMYVAGSAAGVARPHGRTAGDGRGPAGS